MVLVTFIMKFILNTAFFLVFITGCAQISKHDELEFTGCGLLAESAVCQDCFDDKCCSQGVTCAENPNCITLAECINGCPPGDDSCVENCITLSPAGKNDLLAAI